MRPINPVELDRDAWYRIERASRASARVQAQTNLMFARNLTSWANRGGASLAPGVLAGLARAGIDPDSPAGRMLIRDYPEASDGTHRREATARMDADARRAFFEADSIEVTTDDGIREVERPSTTRGFRIPGAGLVGDIAGGVGDLVSGAANVLSAPRRAAMTGGQERVESAGQARIAEQIGATLDPVYESTKTGVRNLTTGLEAPIELGQTAYARGEAARAGGAQSLGLPQPLTSAEYRPPTDVFSPAWESTTLYQQIRGKDVGSGWFAIGPHTEAGRAQAARARRQRGTVAGEAATVGRLFASTVVEPGTLEYNAMSGLTDMAVQIYGDPSAVALGLVGDAAKARKILIPDAAGMVDGPRRWLDPRTASQFLDSPVGGRLADRLAATSDYRTVHQLTRGKLGAEGTLAVTEARTADEVRDVLRPLLGVQIRDVPSGSRAGYAVRRGMRDVRLMQLMPEGSGVHPDDLDDAVEQIQRLLVTGRVADRDVSRIMELTARVGQAENRFDAMYDVMTREVAPALAGSVSRQTGSRELVNAATRLFRDQSEYARRFFIDAVGDAGRIDDVVLGGQVRVVGPHLPSELLNSVVPFPDVRELKRLTSVWAPAWNNPRVRPFMEGPIGFFDWFNQQIFKPFALARIAYPVRVIGEEQFRMAGGGLDSAFRHPLSHIAYVAGGTPDGKLAKAIKKFGIEPKGVTDRLGVEFGASDILDDIADIDPFRRVLNERGEAPLLGQRRPDVTRHWAPFRRGTREHIDGWADEATRLAHDPVSRTVIHAVRGKLPPNVEGQGIDAVKEWFWSGAGQKFRKRLAESKTWGGDAARLADERQFADAYIDSVWERIRVATGENDDLLEALATGKLDGTPIYNTKAGRATPEFRARLSALAKQDVGPETTMARQIGRGTPTAKAGEMYDKGVDMMFYNLAARPTNYLSRSPAFRQFYDRRMAEMASVIDDLGVKQADQLAKMYALHETKKLLYDVHKRGNFFDAMRIVFPFGEAWKEVLTSWVRLTAENPKIIRRAQQSVQGARGAGFFYTDPEDGIEYFNIPWSGELSEKVTGVPFPLRSPVAGLNIVGSGLPGVGPVVQIPASKLIPNEPQWDAVRTAISPFGDPETDSGLFEAFFPGWVQKIRAAGWLEPVGIGPSQTQERTFTTLIDNVMTYKYSTGAYDLSDPEEFDRLFQDSKSAATKLMVIRGLAQSTAPAAPQTVPLVKAKDGRLYELYLMANDYRAMLDEDFETATQRFIDKYGEQAFLVMEPKGKRVVFGIPTTKEADWWAGKNREFVNSFPSVYGFFAPQGGERDYQAYLRALDRGEIEALKPLDWLRLAQHRVANMIYTQARSSVGPNPTEQQRLILSELRDALRDEYPGFRDESVLPSRSDLETSVAQLKDAVNHRSVKGTALAGAIRTYLEARDAAIEHSDGRNLSGQSDEGRRAILREIGALLVEQTPEFQTIWDYLLFDEVEEHDEVGATN